MGLLVQARPISRKFGMMCMFLAQSFFPVSPTIRANIGYLVLLSLASKKAINMILKTLDFPIDNENDILRALVKNATQHKLNVCIIDINTTDINKKIRRNFTDYYILEDKNNNEINIRDINLFSGSGILN